MKHKSSLYRGKVVAYQTGHSYAMPLIILLFFLASMIGILLLEYRFFYVQSQKMIALQEQYQTYLNIVKKIVNKSIKNGTIKTLSIDYKLANTLDDSSISNPHQSTVNFLIVNRKPEYLKQSMFEYFKIQQLDSLLMHIDPQEWLDYSNQIVSTTAAKDCFYSKSKLKTKHQKNKINCLWPIDQQSFWLSSLFGPRKKVNGSWGFHYGIDMAAMKGTPIKAAHTGNVIEAGYTSGYGNTIVIQYNKSFKTRYAHLENIKVSKGKKIKKGTYIGTVGDTGFVRKRGKDGSHLHFEVYKNEKQVNPLYVLPPLFAH